MENNINNHRRIGFEVPEWRNKPFDEYTNEELLEYWYKLRLTYIGKKEATLDDSTSLFVVHLQNEIISRMKK